MVSLPVALYTELDDRIVQRPGGDNESNPPAPCFFGVWYGLGTKGGVFELSV
jgi:hypothetical protein